MTMATSTIKNMSGAEEISVTLINNFEVPTWGYVRAYKAGSLCIVYISGLRRTTAVTSNTEFATIGAVPKLYTTGSLIDGNTESAIAQTNANSSRLWVNSMTANVTYFGQMVFPIN